MLVDFVLQSQQGKASNVYCHFLQITRASKKLILFAVPSWSLVPLKETPKEPHQVIPIRSLQLRTTRHSLIFKSCNPLAVTRAILLCCHKQLAIVHSLTIIVRRIYSRNVDYRKSATTIPAQNGPFLLKVIKGESAITFC